MPGTFDRSALATVHLVPLSAFDAAGRLNRDAQAGHIEHLASAGVRVFLPAAGTSEYQSLSPDEIVESVAVTRRAAGESAIIFAPVGLQIQTAIETAQRALDAGANGIMFMPFAHPYLCDPGVQDYYHAVLERVNCPAMIYKSAPVPSDALLLELADHPQVVGVKYAVNNLHDFRRLASSGKPVEWLCGSAERFAPYFMLAGARGYTSGAGNICPRLTLAMHAGLLDGRFDEAMRLQKLILPIEEFRARDCDSFNISMLKAALEIAGRDFGPPRPPQRQLTLAERAEVATIVRSVLDAENDLARQQLAATLLLSDDYE